MIILEKPFVSDFLIETISKNNYPVLDTKFARSFKFNDCANFISENDAVLNYKTPIYTNSENSYSWLIKNLPKTRITEKLNLFNDKVCFRNLIEKLYPDYYFEEIDIDELESFDIDGIPKPFIIKPAMGFFSLAVYKVSNKREWENTKKLIRDECESIKDLFPPDVLDVSRFIIEEYIEGSEFAFDAYYNSSGEPVILSILEHVFSSDSDVNDRAYLSSKEIINANLEPFTNFLTEIGNLVELKNFPLHVEVRKNKEGKIIPIEINPLRFGGFCTTADFTYYTYGFNPYEYFFKQKAPNWNDILVAKDDNIYCLIVLDNSTGIDGKEINHFDYDKLLTQFTKPLHMRKMDIKQYPVFGFLFVETNKNDFKEIENILHSDLKEFITY